MNAEIYEGDCLEIMKRFSDSSIQMIYLDPPFFTQKIHSLRTKDRKHTFSFSDVWATNLEYIEFLQIRLEEMHRLLSDSGSIFFHCDRNSSHYARILLNEIFGEEMFRSEIIWHYRRWSNSKSSLLPSHQTIFHYTKSNQYFFNTMYEEYSPSTNVDQILQRRRRDEHGKSIYERNLSGKIVSNGGKKGVPLSDVWDIPYLNPKAKERVGYPTQKPLLLLERLMDISTRGGDLVLDPFCGSGTTIIAAHLLNRRAIGIDISSDAVKITRQRLDNPIKSESRLLEKGRESYVNADQEVLSLLQGLSFVPVQRNKGIDAILREDISGHPILIRVQRSDETMLDAAYALLKAVKEKSPSLLLLVAINRDELLFDESLIPPEVVVIDAPSLLIENIVTRLKNEKLVISKS
jgi:site-specific DNA-methyltransferase (adenine-specific)